MKRLVVAGVLVELLVNTVCSQTVSVVVSCDDCPIIEQQVMRLASIQVENWGYALVDKNSEYTILLMMVPEAYTGMDTMGYGMSFTLLEKTRYIIGGIRRISQETMSGTIKEIIHACNRWILSQPKKE